MKGSESTEINKSRQKSPNLNAGQHFSAKVGASRQKSTLFTAVGTTSMKWRRIIGERHRYWNIKGCGDAARVSTGKFLFFRGKGCGGFCSRCGTNVPPQILPRFSTLRQSKWKEIYGKTQN